MDCIAKCKIECKFWSILFLPNIKFQLKTITRAYINMKTWRLNRILTINPHDTRKVVMRIFHVFLRIYTTPDYNYWKTTKSLRKKVNIQFIYINCKQWIYNSPKIIGRIELTALNIIVYCKQSSMLHWFLFKL